MSAAARAEARRKAILSRGSDRLAKLTTSARGEDSPAYLRDDKPIGTSTGTSTSSFLGEESSNMPTPSGPSLSPSPSPRPSRKVTPSQPANIFENLTSGTSMDSDAWSPEQQQQFMQALMNASGAPLFGQTPPAALPSSNSRETSSPPIPMDNPLAALLQAQLGPDAGNGAGMFPPFGPGMDGKFQPVTTEPQKAKTKLQKLMPLFHLIAMWCLLAYFVLWAEPMAYSEGVTEELGLNAVGIWRRWASLGSKSPLVESSVRRFTVQVVPFFWAFTTLQILLHSLRIFSGFDAVQPPTLLALALPHLPPPLPSLIVNSLKYIQMGSLFLDDLSGLVVGIGFIIYFSGWLAQ